MLPTERRASPRRILDNLIDVRDDGSFALNLDYFDYCTGLTMTNGRFDALFGGPPRQTDQLLDQRHMDLAASIQAVTELVVSRLATHLGREFGQRNLCLAGGVALNCVANGKLLRQGQFDNIWIQPAAGDAGGALGAALAASHMHLKAPRRVRNSPDGMEGGYLGPAYDGHSEIATALTAAGARFHKRSERGRRSARRPRRSRPERPWDGSRGAWSLGRGRSATGRSSAIRARPPCRSFSISR